MTAQVIFLPGVYQISEMEMIARMMAQDEFSLFHIEFEQTYRHLEPWQYFLKKEEFHHRLRQSITLVKK